MQVIPSTPMAPHLEQTQTHQVTQIHVRIDCNGCLHKIKKTLNRIKGIYEYNIDSSQQKVTIVGWADPEKIVKAIRKTNRMATICSQPEQPVQSSSQQPQQETPENEPAAAAPPPLDQAAAAPNTEETSAAASTTEETKPTTEPLEDTKLEAASTTETTSHPAQSSGSKHVGEEVHIVHHYPHSYGYGGQLGNSSNIIHGGFRPEPVYITQSYNSYNPSPYLTEYQYVNPPPYQYNDIDYRNINNGNGNITSVFSDENPNACIIT